MAIALGDLGSVGVDEGRLKRLDGLMQGYVDRGVYAGIVAAVARRGTVVHAGAYGWSDREAGTPMADDTVFRLYSMTKPIVCTALMMLVEEGRLTLIDPVAKHLPAFAGVKVLAPDGGLVDPVRPMTVGDLMAHTSGLSYHFLGDSPVSKMYEDALVQRADVPLAAAIDDLARFPLAAHPGSRWIYSVGIDVAARVVEVVSKRPLGDALRALLFEPLGMDDTGFGVAEGARGRLAAMYGRPDLLGPGVTHPGSFATWAGGENRPVDVSRSYPVDRAEVFQRGGHGLFGTAGDYLRFAQMLCDGGTFEGRRVVGRKTLDLMRANRIPAGLLPLEIGGVPLRGYGFGLGSRVLLDVAASAAPGTAGEFGWAGAAKTHYWVDPGEGIVAVFMTQSMMSFDAPELAMRAVVYGALE